MIRESERTVSGQADRTRHVISRDTVSRDEGTSFPDDPAVFGDLGSFARLVHEITGQDHKGRSQPVDGIHRQFEIRGILREILVFVEPTELCFAQ